MKKIALALAIFCVALVGCDDEFLRETPDDFLTIENSFTNAAQFRTGLNHFYTSVRQNYNFQDNPIYFFHYGSGTDLYFRPNSDSEIFTDWSYLNSTHESFRVMFGRHFGLLYNINQLLIQSENKSVKWITENEKLEVQAEARFFRAYCYRMLGYMWGGVPVLETLVTKPRLDFTRNSRQEVYEFAVADLAFAAEHLPIQTSLVGGVVRAAACHYLSEVSIALGDEYAKNGDATKAKAMYDKAVEAGGRVIDQKVGEYHLMQERFGYNKNVAGKDAFWDLFQMKPASGPSNFSYQNGNKESIWVIQVDKFLQGGLNDGLTTRTDQERVFWPTFWGWSGFFGFNGVARPEMGRGIAWLRATNHFNYTIWDKTGPEDNRNAEWNINRVLRCPYPVINGVVDPTKDTTYVTKVTLRGGKDSIVNVKPNDIVKPEWLGTRTDTMERWYPRVSKLGSDWKHNDDAANGFVMEFYAIRMAETYLIRAEAHMKAGNNAKAADDINVVRARAKATPVAASDVNIDYILDERMRELNGEEFRTATLCRLGLLYDRAKRFGYDVVSRTVSEKCNLMPIPQTVIDANSQAVFGQNPGW